jgi:hypothetical protein
LSAVRKSATGQSYGCPSPDDNRFDYRCGAIQSIVTSSGQADAGMFEPNLRDERYLPFEGAGAVSTWRLELPAALPSFDYATISDVILHLRYTARDGGTLLRDAAIKQLTGAGATPMARVVTIRSEFPMEWARFKAVQTDENTAAELTIELRPEHYPFWARNLVATQPAQYRLYAKPTPVTSGQPDSDNADIALYDQKEVAQAQLVATMGSGQMNSLLSCDLRGPTFTTFSGRKSLFLDNSAVDDLWLLVSG